MTRRLVFILALVLALVVVSSPLQASSLESRVSEPAEETFHVVELGETLFSIARRYGTTVDAIALANGLADPSLIYVGQRLTVPLAPDPDTDDPGWARYVVQVGDTLTTIALRYGTTWRDLVDANDLISPHRLSPGQVIRVPARDLELGGMLHVVEPGETLFRIAVRYGVSPLHLAAVNTLSNPSLLYPGQRLLIPGEGEGLWPAPFRSVGVHPTPVRQGQTLVIDVRTTEPVTLTGTLFDRDLRFIEEDSVHYALVGVHVFTDPGHKPLTIRAVDRSGRTTNVNAQVLVEAGDFGYERIYAPPGTLDPAVTAAENALIDSFRSRFTERREWMGPLLRPGDGSISSYFGTRRSYNDGPFTSYHAGVDLRGATGTPVHAPATGTVVLAEELIVRGRAILLDHGWGVVTGYWHLDAIEVEVGQRVERGDVIGLIGNTGLSMGSHLHWEMWIDGVPVNPIQWLEPFYAWPHPGEGAGDD